MNFGERPLGILTKRVRAGLRPAAKQCQMESSGGG